MNLRNHCRADGRSDGRIYKKNNNLISVSSSANVIKVKEKRKRSEMKKRRQQETSKMKNKKKSKQIEKNSDVPSRRTEEAIWVNAPNPAVSVLRVSSFSLTHLL